MDKTGTITRGEPEVVVMHHGKSPTSWSVDLPDRLAWLSPYGTEKTPV